MPTIWPNTQENTLSKMCLTILWTLTIGGLNFINLTCKTFKPFLANVCILHPLKTTDIERLNLNLKTRNQICENEKCEIIRNKDYGLL